MIVASSSLDWQCLVVTTGGSVLFVIRDGDVPRLDDLGHLMVMAAAVVGWSCVQLLWQVDRLVLFVNTGWGFLITFVHRGLLDAGHDRGGLQRWGLKSCLSNVGYLIFD